MMGEIFMCKNLTKTSFSAIIYMKVFIKEFIGNEKSNTSC